MTEIGPLAMFLPDIDQRSIAPFLDAIAAQSETADATRQILSAVTGLQR